MSFLLIRSLAAGVVIAACSIGEVLAFQPAAKDSVTRQHQATTTTCLFSSPTTPEEMFASEGWKSIKKELDTVPTFCCANEQGQPLQYNVNEEVKMPFFYCDVKAAEEELGKAKSEITNKEITDGLGIIPFPLGTAFELMAQNQAIVIPAQTELIKAGAPITVNPLGQQVPLFACMEIMQENSSGRPVLPIFMVHSEAKSAMQEALQELADSGDAGENLPQEFEIVSLSLPRVVDAMANDGSNSPSFQVLPPQESINYIQEYLQD